MHAGACSRRFPLSSLHSRCRRSVLFITLPLWTGTLTGREASPDLPGPALVNQGLGELEGQGQTPQAWPGRGEPVPAQALGQVRGAPLYLYIFLFW